MNGNTENYALKMHQSAKQKRSASTEAEIKGGKFEEANDSSTTSII
jgi:hypothetical protein